jgi:hypothetical protein
MSYRKSDRRRGRCVSGAEPGNRIRSNFPIKTNNQLASLLRVVRAGDGKPVGNIGPIFNDLKAELKAETDRLQRTLTTLLPRFNQLAQRLGLDQISER